MDNTQRSTVLLLVVAAVLTLVFAVFQDRIAPKLALPVPVKPATIEMNAQGFVPPSLTVKANSTVCWVNADKAEHHPVSDGASPVPFDPGKGLKAGETWCYPFSKEGVWAYHEKEKPEMRGKVMVTP